MTAYFDNPGLDAPAGVKPFAEAASEGMSYKTWIRKELRPESGYQHGATALHRINGAWYADNFSRGELLPVTGLCALQIEAEWMRLEWQRTGVEPEGLAALSEYLEASEITSEGKF
jgi:hypothetical protein